MPRFIVLSEPRTGSTYLQSLLNVHVDVCCTGDILGDEHGPKDDPVADVDRQLSALRQPVVGFKTFPEHLVYHRLSLPELVRRLDVSWVIVVWRRNSLEMYASLQIARRTGIWYSAAEPTTDVVETVEVKGSEFLQYVADTERLWRDVVRGWPPDVVPIFVEYEELAKTTESEMRRVLRRMSVDPTDYDFQAECRRQNPAPASRKVSTWKELTDAERRASIDIPSIVNDAVRRELNVPEECAHLLPDREPPAPPPPGWLYRVAEPHITSASRENVVDAVDSGSVSSAARWPHDMSGKLKQIFGAAVAQPCCNGFAAIVLALRASRVGPGDAVILPTFTMIAVPNAVRTVGARPVPVDNAPVDYNPGVREIEAAADDSTKAVIVTHTYGVPTSGMQSIAALCRRRRWFLIEDISECAGISTTVSDGSRRLLGTFGDFACASMYANKLLHGGDGGFVLAKDAIHGQRLGSLVNHGFTRSYHFVHLEAAPNFKISGLAAALACGILDSVDDIVRHRSLLARTYRRCLTATPLQLMPRCGPDDTPWVFGVCCADKAQRRSLRSLLAERGVETRNYFFPIHAQPAYGYEIASGVASFPNANHLAETGFYLPTYTALSEKDVEWICAVIASFFANRETTAECPKSVLPRNSIRVNSATLQLETRQMDENGQLVGCFAGFSHHTTVAVSLLSQAERYLVMERWDRGQILLQNMQQCVAECRNRKNGFDVAERVLQPYVDYVISQRKYELSIEEPWTNVDLTEGDLGRCSGIPTTTEPEVLQLLYWLVQGVRGTPHVLELGSLFGASTAAMAVAARRRSPDARLLAVDTFVWQKWMDRFNFGVRRKTGECFLDEFRRNTSFVSDIIQVVQCDVRSDEFRTETLDGLSFDVVFVDFTRDVDELETTWKRVRPHLKPDVSVVILNTVDRSNIPFVVSHSDELVPIAKPRGTRAKAYRFVNPVLPEVTGVRNAPVDGRRLRVVQSPDWNHHHGRAFNVAIDAVRRQLHSSDAAVDFIPAIEEFLCDFRDQIRRPWVGIVHGVAEDDQFYPPDMKRLCGRRYRSVMKLCRGLFTLTDSQAAYLRDHLDADRPIPICPLRLPMLPPETGLHRGDVVSRWKESGSVDLVFVGSFARDFSLFFEAAVPSGVRKVMLCGDEQSDEWAAKAPKDVAIRSRLGGNDYEEMLGRSIVMLALKYAGAANTITLECIARNVPIVAPRVSSCVDYLGASYPLLYDRSCRDMTHVLAVEKVQQAVDYLSQMDKSAFSIGRFCETIQSSSVLLSLPSEIDGLQHLTATFDVTVCMCSYRRTDNLPRILDSILRGQTFCGTVQVIVWNNNEARERVVREICEPYVARNSSRRSLELVSSTVNHYCIVRTCMSQLMRSDVLLICDDDVVPSASFVQFFVDAHRRHARDVLAVRGHRFLPHRLDHADPRAEWRDYEHVRFVDDGRAEQSVHFLHADTCLVPREALRELASIPLPDSAFALVDDYWMSFVLGHHFKRNLRKLQCRDGEHFTRTADSDEPGLALYTRPEVEDARVRMYVHHMLHGWPDWSSERVAASATVEPADSVSMKSAKTRWWNGHRAFVGYNVASDLTRDDAADLRRLGADVVRIGAVGCREDGGDFELAGFLDDPPTAQLRELRGTVEMLAEFGIGVIVTLNRRVASAELWRLIADEFRRHPNVIGYDLVNEPNVASDVDRHYTDVVDTPPTALKEYFDTVSLYRQQIRTVDAVTPIVIEPTFWAKPCSLPLLSDFVAETRRRDPNIVVSVHFYEPRPLVSRTLNRGRYQFPGTVPLYDCPNSELEEWNVERIHREVEKISQWQTEHGVTVFVGGRWA